MGGERGRHCYLLRQVWAVVNGYGAGVSPWRRMISRSLLRSGGFVGLAPLNTSAVSRKYSGPRAAGVITQSDLESWLMLLSKR